jgi:PIN domain nuclease of toxin-antitoxin system
LIVLDTSVLIYWNLDPVKLTEAAEQAIKEADQIIVSSISIWEMGLKAKRGRLELPLSIAEYTQRLQKLERLEITPVDVNIWLENLSLNWGHRDPADRTIVATASLLNCPLVTSDRTIRAFYKQSIW